MITTTDFQLTIRIIILEIWKKNWEHWISSNVALNFKNGRIDAFELCCWRTLLRVPWTIRRPNQSILKEINPEYSLERLMLKLKLQYFRHLIWRANSLEKTCCWERLKAGEGNDRGRDGWWHHQLNGHDFEKDMRDGEGQGSLACCSRWGHKQSDTTEGLNNNNKWEKDWKQELNSVFT